MVSFEPVTRFKITFVVNIISLVWKARGRFTLLEDLELDSDLLDFFLPFFLKKKIIKGCIGNDLPNYYCLVFWIDKFLFFKLKTTTREWLLLFPKDLFLCSRIHRRWCWLKFENERMESYSRLRPCTNIF